MGAKILFSAHKSFDMQQLKKGYINAQGSVAFPVAKDFRSTQCLVES
jgi:hypothetical protein